MEPITRSTQARCQGERGVDSTSRMPTSRACFRKVLAENGIAIAQQVARQLVEGKGLPQLLSGPLRGRMRGHIEVNNATTVMSQNQKHVQDLETEGGHGEEVDGDQLP
jgi:hypothetical protein